MAARGVVHGRHAGYLLSLTNLQAMRSRIFEPSLAAYTIDLPHRFLVSVVSAPDLNSIGIMDNPVQNGAWIPFTN